MFLKGRHRMMRDNFTPPPVLPKRLNQRDSVRLDHTDKSIALSGTWLSNNLFLPHNLTGEMTPLWVKCAMTISAIFPGTHFFISSVKSSYTGSPREEWGSHIRGVSMDVAPMWSSDINKRPDEKSPRLGDRRDVLHYAARAWPDSFPALFAEGDHFHVDQSRGHFVWAYPTYRTTSYHNDSEDPCSTLRPGILRVTKDGQMLKAIQ